MASEEALDGRGPTIEALFRTIESSASTDHKTRAEASFGIGLVHWHTARYAVAAGDFHEAAGYFKAAAVAADAATPKAKTKAPAAGTDEAATRGFTPQPSLGGGDPNKTGDDFRLDQLRAVTNEALAWRRSGLTAEDVRAKIAALPEAPTTNRKEQSYLQGLLAYAVNDRETAQRLWTDVVPTAENATAIKVKLDAAGASTDKPPDDQIALNASLSLVGQLIKEGKTGDARKLWDSVVEPMRGLAK